MSIATVSQSVLHTYFFIFCQIFSGNHQSPDRFGGQELNGIDYQFHENSKQLFHFVIDCIREFNQLKEILRQYKPDKELARANTINRRKNKKIIMEKIKSSLLSKFQIKLSGLKRKSEGQQISGVKFNKDLLNKSSTHKKLNPSYIKRTNNLNHALTKEMALIKNSPLSNPRKNSNESGTDQNSDQILSFKTDQLIKKDISITDADQKQNKSNPSLSLKEQKSEKLLKKHRSSIELEEDILFFQYNSDGEYQWDDIKSEMNSYVKLQKTTTLKKMKTSFDNFNSSYIRENSQMHNTNDQINQSSHSNNRSSTFQSKKTDHLNYHQIHKLNQIYQRNPNTNFQLDKSGNAQYNSTEINNSSNNQYGNYLTVQTAGLSTFHKMKTSQEDQPYYNDTAELQSKYKGINKMKTVTYDPSLIDPSEQSVQKLSKIKKFIHNIQAIEEECSEQSSPAMTSKRFSFQKGNMETDPKQLSPTQTQKLGTISSRSSLTDHDIETSKNEDEAESTPAVSSKKFTSVLTLNRYNKIYTQEFKEEDIEIMNINSRLKELNSQLQKISFYQFLFVALGWILFILDEQKGQNLKDQKVLSKELALRGIDYTSAFLLKVWLTMNPIKGLILGVSFIILLNSYILLLNERVQDIDALPCYGQDHQWAPSQYRDSVWLLMITFMTVGYGDYYPTTSAGRYIAIITAICGQMYSAIVIGLIHAQLQLTSEESGVNKSFNQFQVLKIISNNKKEKSKRIIAATLVYYVLKMAGVRNKQLQKGNIHWYETREVDNIRFEIYVNVMQFKQLKHDLQVYYSSRNTDSTLNLVRNIENKLALLAHETGVIFNSVKDQKMERKKNISEGYFRQKSLMHQILEEEANKGNKSYNNGYKHQVQSQKHLSHVQISPVKKDNLQNQQSPQLNNIRFSQTMAPGKISHFGNQKQVNYKNKLDDYSIEEEDYEYSSCSSSELESIKNKSKLIQKYSMIDSSEEQISITQRLAQRKQDQQIKREFTQLSQQTSFAPSPAQRSLKSAQKGDQLKFASQEDFKIPQLQFDKPSLKSGSAINFQQSADNQLKTQSIQRKEEIQDIMEEELKLSIKGDQKLMNNKIKQKSSNYSIQGPKMSRFLKTKTLTKMKSHDQITPKRKQSTLKSTPKNRKSSQLLKSNTQINFSRMNSLKSNISNDNNNRLKQQKTQMHPTLVSIIEEEEYLTEDDEDFQLNQEINHADNDLEEIKEDCTSLDQDSVSDQDSTTGRRQVQQKQSQNQMRNFLQMNKVGKSEAQHYCTNDSRNSRPLSNNDILREKSLSSLSQAFDDYKLKESINQSLQIMSRIFENQKMLLQPKQIKPKLFSFTSNDEILSDQSPELMTQKYNSQISGSGFSGGLFKVGQQTRKQSDMSFQISEDQYISSSQKSSSPLKQSVIIPQKDPQSHQEPKRSTPLKEKQQRISLLNPQLLKVQSSQASGSELGLSPILPMRNKPPQQKAFKLQLLSAQSSENYEDLQKLVAGPSLQTQQTVQLNQNPSKRIDLLEIIERQSSSPSLSFNQKQSIISFQEQINQILNSKESLQNSGIIPKELLFNGSQRLSSFSNEMNSKQKTTNEKEQLRQELKNEGQEISGLCQRMQQTDKIVGKAISEAKQKIQRLKASQGHPTLQVNVINTTQSVDFVNNIIGLIQTQNNHIEQNSEQNNINNTNNINTTNNNTS